MEIQIYDLPTQGDGISAIEKKYCQLLNKHRNGESLDDVERDWMDQANNILMETK